MIRREIVIRVWPDEAVLPPGMFFELKPFMSGEYGLCCCGFHGDDHWDIESAKAIAECFQAAIAEAERRNRDAEKPDSEDA